MAIRFILCLQKHFMSLRVFTNSVIKIIIKTLNVLYAFILAFRRYSTGIRFFYSNYFCICDNLISVSYFYRTAIKQIFENS